MSLRGRFRGSGVSDLESGGEREGKGGRGAAGEGDQPDGSGTAGNL